MVSTPQYWMVAMKATGTMLSLLLLLFVQIPVFTIALLAIAAVNLIGLPRLAWGFELNDDTLSISYPLWPRANRSIALGDITGAHLVASSLPLFSYGDRVSFELVDGSRLRLSALGTTEFGHLVHFAQTRAAARSV